MFNFNQNTENAKDLLSETIVTAFEKFDKIHTPEVFLHFLFGIAIRHNQNGKRKYRKIEYLEKIPKVEDITNVIETNENLEHLYKALNQLPENQREAIILFEISGFSTEEIAEMQNCKPDAVRQRLSRGRERLRKLLGVRTREKVVAMALEPISAIILLFFSSENVQPISDDELDSYFKTARNQEPVLSLEEIGKIIQSGNLPVSPINKQFPFTSFFKNWQFLFITGITVFVVVLYVASKFYFDEKHKDKVKNYENSELKIIQKDTVSIREEKPTIQSKDKAKSIKEKNFYDMVNSEVE